jgi:hypothetical protein
MNPIQELENKLGVLKFIGYHENEQLPFKQKQRVKIPKGTYVKSTNPKYKTEGKRGYGGFHLKRDLWVTIHHFGCGQCVEEHDYLKDYKHYYPNAPIVETKYGLKYATQNPSIIWVGAGGYWHEVDINAVLK